MFLLVFFKMFKWYQILKVHAYCRYFAMIERQFLIIVINKIKDTYANILILSSNLIFYSVKKEVEKQSCSFYCDQTNMYGAKTIR